jgi:hypothetical protein
MLASGISTLGFVELRWRAGLSISAASNNYGVRGAIIQWLLDKKLREGVWKEIVKLHFVVNGDDILKTVKDWSKHKKNVNEWNGRFDFRLGGARYVSGVTSGGIDLVAWLEREVEKFRGGEDDPELTSAVIESLSIK